MIAAVADTHTLIWFVYSDARLSNRAKSFMNTAAESGNIIAFSSVSLIEMVYLIEKGRIAVESSTRLTRALNTSSLYLEVAVDLTIARTLSRIDATQIPDMPDRIVAATAVMLEVPLISRDGRIRASTIQTIW